MNIIKGRKLSYDYFRVDEDGKEGIYVCQGLPKPAYIKTFDDHRMAMSFSVTGLMAEGIVIENPMCCRKTFENFYEVLESIL